MKTLKIGLTSVISILFLFFIFLFLQNGTTMIIEMESTQKSPLHAQIFFTQEGQPFVTKNSRRAYKREKNNYYLKLPKPEEMQYIRFDPTRKKYDITLKKITLSTTTWFKTSLYDIATTNIIPVHQIENFTSSNKEVRFSTTGNDPHFNMQLASTHVSTTYNTYLNLLIIAIILFAAFMYLLHIYKLNKPENNPNLTPAQKDLSLCQH